MRKVYQKLKEARHEDVEDIMENGLQYMRTLHSRNTPEGALYSWEKTFPGQSRSEVEASLGRLGFDQHEWLDNGALRWEPSGDIASQDTITYPRQKRRRF